MLALYSSVQHPETSADPHIAHPRWGPSDHDDTPGIDPLESSFRHAGWAAERRRIYQALKDAGAGDRRLGRFADCGQQCWLCHDGSELVITGDFCHDRWCLPCQTARRAALAEAVHLKILDSGECRMLTLTLRTTKRHKLPDLLQRLQADFRRLRQRQWWKRHVTGGIAALEVKAGKRGNWHPHLHVIVAGKRISHAQLSAEWLAVTGDSSIVWVTPIPSGPAGGKKAAAYLAKYACKPLHVGSLDATMLATAVKVLKGRKLITTLGSWEGIEHAQDDVIPRTLQRICPLRRLWEPQNERWLAAALRKWPALAQHTPHPTTSDEEFIP